MSDSPRRAGSRWRLFFFLALAIAPPVALVLGPFRGRFFPDDVEELRALAVVVEPRLDRAALRELAGGRDADEGWLAELAREFDARRFDALVERLGALPPERVTPGLMYLHGLCALLANRPAAALAGLQAAHEAGGGALSHEAGFALAQAFLMLGRREPALALLLEISRAAGPRSDQAWEQLLQL
jgi:hypothetical protein